jgi:hypothetical protein
MLHSKAVNYARCDREVAELRNPLLGKDWRISAPSKLLVVDFDLNDAGVTAEVEQATAKIELR